MERKSVERHHNRQGDQRPLRTSSSRVRVSAVTLQPAEDLDIQLCMAMLPFDERAVAERMNNSEARARFLQCRTILRMLLGEATGDGYYAEPFLYGPHGKPALREERSLQFNLAHSGEFAVFAISEWKHSLVGVDVERSRPRPGAMAIARRFFHPHEIAHLTSFATEQREAEFLRIWVRKEASVKALGMGLEDTLSGFSVHDTIEPVLLEDGSTIWLYDVAFGMPAAAALACTQPLAAVDVSPLLPATTWLYQLYALS